MRLEWAYDSDALLSCVAGTLRRHVGDASTILDGPSILDARWRADGSIVSIDGESQLRRYADGITELPRVTARTLTAVWLGTDDRYFALAPDGSITTFDGIEVWRYGFQTWGRVEVAASDDLRYVAVASETMGSEGRRWIAIDTRNHTVANRQWVPAKLTSDLVKLAFDGACKRLAVVLPNAASVGAIRIGRSDTYPRDHLGGASAVALDARGLLAAYAYPRGTGPRKLRVDYLERGVKGDTRIPIIDTLWIDPDLDDIIAVAFDRASRRIACLGASGTIEIVPVP